MKNAIVERRRRNRRTLLVRARACAASRRSSYGCVVCAMCNRRRFRCKKSEAPTGASPPTSGSSAQRAFELVLGPLDDLVELLVALREFGDHHGIDRLIVHLG